MVGILKIEVNRCTYAVFLSHVEDALCGRISVLLPKEVMVCLASLHLEMNVSNPA